ncbi:hypothetical protein PanWU01x14_296520 [Parasponia andersonii]|uniref:Uncharacterized protein n=1 Tax=Parasponia andersonii TaxID=3476 RepID=A0A2P5AVF6_PARAD|nr:hypothetical protein PanWU01x14_296520 [Parasponia andersonii]
MRSNEHKQSKLKHYMLTPIRALSRARDFYVKMMMNDCVGVDCDGGVVGPSAPALSRFPKRFSTVNLPSNDDENLRKLLRMVSSERNINHVEINKDLGSDDHMQRQGVIVRQGPMSMGYGGGIMGSYSVGLGKIGRIDEDRPCTFEEDIDLTYPRSKSYAVN